ncbi:hypothetical protein [Agrococcus sp. DT81.2]|uniref:hypothetical protein n=1 Tax=Agrococcus sp. DT81.2 TaxID=3393414 RepID=UPI003CE55296
MPARRARLGLAHALAWTAIGLAMTAIATDALRHDGGSLALAFGGALAAAGAAVGLLLPRIAGARPLALAAGVVAALAIAAAAALALFGEPVGVAPVAALGLAAGAHSAAMAAAAVRDPTLAPRVRAAPTLLAAAVGAAFVAAAAPSPAITFWALLATAVALELLSLALLAVAGSGAWPQGLGSGIRDRVQGMPAVAAPAPRALLGLLVLAAAGAVAMAALRPALSALGADEPAPAGPAALTLAIGAVAGPPLARLAERLLPRPRAAAALATLGGVAALAAPVARPGALDLAAAAVLGCALAAAVALAELARRSELGLSRATPAVLALAGAAGAALAGLLLAAVPLPDAVLAAALACLVAGLGMWAPALLSAPDRQPAS